MATEQVLVTGLGVSSCLGTDLETYWTRLLSAHHRPAPVNDPAAHMANRLLYASVDPPPGNDPHAGRASRLGEHAARSALRDAGLLDGDDPAAVTAEVGLAIGTGVGDADLFETGRAGGPTPTGPAAYPFTVATSLAGALALTGPMLSVSTACSASAYSVSLAAEAIRRGETEVMLTGGADCYTRVGLGCFNRMRGLDPEFCRPFAADRRGTVFGEGAAMLVLESEAHARARGRYRCYGTIESAGWSCDAYHPTAPDPGAHQIVRAIQDAISGAGLQPSQIGCVVPHGTGTPLNDTVESEALAAVFGHALDSLTIYSLKAMIGHTGGAAGAFALLTAALIASRRTAPPNPVRTAPDPQCRLTIHSDAPVRRDFGRVLVNAYAFGGNNISVLVGPGPDGFHE
jgi:3-oxoacyl-[acyl-carrier-protein] synthase II